MGFKINSPYQLLLFQEPQINTSDHLARALSETYKIVSNLVSFYLYSGRKKPYKIHIFLKDLVNIVRKT